MERIAVGVRNISARGTFGGDHLPDENPPSDDLTAPASDRDDIA